MHSKCVFASVFPQGQKTGLHLDTNGAPQPSLAATAPPNLQPFFDDMSDNESQSNLMSSLKVTPPPLIVGVHTSLPTLLLSLPLLFVH